MTDKDKIIRLIEDDSIRIGLRSDDILHVEFKENSEITIEVQNHLLQTALELTEGMYLPIIYEAEPFVSLANDAKKNATLMEAQFPHTASAIVVKNLAQRIIADFYYKVKPTKRPYKIVTDFDKGIEWLKTNYPKKTTPY